jgi:hypothetical protein
MISCAAAFNAAASAGLFVPRVSIEFSAVRALQRGRLGHNYVLEYTFNLEDRFPAGPAFTAQSETVTNEFDLNGDGPLLPDSRSSLNGSEVGAEEIVTGVLQQS